MADCLHKIPLLLKEAILIKENLTYEIMIPCGKCARCLTRRKAEWGFRMSHEMKESKTAYFVTLTYAPETIPYNKYGLKTLVPTRQVDKKLKEIDRNNKVKIDTSLEGFFKRLRQNHFRSKKTIEHLVHNVKNTDKIKYYGAGEYGEERGRPHYHAIIYNTSYKTIENSWTLGTVHIVPANDATIAYVMKYLDKHKDKKQDKRRQEEFNVMSEGIGLSYIEKYIHWHKQNIDVLYVMTPMGIKIPMPKYYREKIFTEEQRKLQVMLVSNKLEDIRTESIEELGISVYNDIRVMEQKYTDHKFNKKIKKRIID